MWQPFGQLVVLDYFLENFANCRSLHLVFGNFRSIKSSEDCCSGQLFATGDSIVSIFSEQVVRAGDKEGKEKDQQNQQASIWASSSSSSVLQLALQQMAKTKELEETMEESKSKAGGLKRHATRSTNFLSWSNSNIFLHTGQRHHLVGPIHLPREEPTNNMHSFLEIFSHRFVTIVSH